MRLLLPGCLRRAWCWRVRLSGPPSCPDDHGILGEAGTGRSSCVSLRLLFALALFAPGIWFIISVVLVPGSHCSLRLGVAVVYG